ncbi:MAG: hypothetical protein K0S46_713 [Moraxellaceae bacterium]|jgi:hypothetical protein|nr:hypothetical protein [Moraxellaceae bacterium]
MMKKLLAIAVLSTSATVAVADQDIGCGLGSMIMAGQSGPVFKVLGATTNGTFGNQTFGITTGTLGCQSSGAITSRARLSMFTGSNIDNLARDMSVGRGESLNVLADLMGVKDADKDHFFQATKTNFGKIFAPQNESAGQVLAALEQVMTQDSVLVGYVPKA